MVVLHDRENANLVSEGNVMKLVKENKNEVRIRLFTYFLLILCRGETNICIVAHSNIFEDICNYKLENADIAKLS